MFIWSVYVFDNHVTFLHSYTKYEKISDTKSCACLVSHSGASTGGGFGSSLLPSGL